MQIVINISKELYDRYKEKDHIKRCDIDEFEKALDNCITLPEDHGDLIDADALIDTLGCSDRDEYTRACIEEDASIIIEADRSVKR